MADAPRTPYLLLHNCVSFSAVVIERSSVHVQMPPTSLRLSKRVTLNPNSLSSLRAAIPAGPERQHQHSAILNLRRSCQRRTPANYSNPCIATIHTAVTALLRIKVSL
jgi:hypothetical protein